MPVYVVVTRGDNTRLAKENDIAHKRYKLAQGTTVTEFVVNASNRRLAEERIAKITGPEAVVMAVLFNEGEE